MSQNEENCQNLQEESSNFFSDAKVLKRIENYETYFTQINTVANNKVWNSSSKSLLPLHSGIEIDLS